MAETSFARHRVAPRASMPLVVAPPPAQSNRPREDVLPPHSDLDALARVGRRRAGQVCAERATALQGEASRPTLLRRVFGAGPVRDAEKEAFDAARGERIVGRELDRLPGSWVTLHSLPAPGASGDLDHVVVGPGGVFAITTRFVDVDRVFVADDYLLARGRRVPFARASIAAVRRTAQLAGRTLPADVLVRPVLVVAGVRTVRVGARARAVDVRDVALVRAWLESQPTVLDAQAVQRVAARVAVAFEETATASAASDAATMLAHESRFQRLEREVAAAGRIRRLWRAGGAVAVSAGVWIAFAQLPSWLALQLG